MAPPAGVGAVPVAAVKGTAVAEFTTLLQAGAAAGRSGRAGQRPDPVSATGAWSPPASVTVEPGPELLLHPAGVGDVHSANASAASGVNRVCVMVVPSCQKTPRSRGGVRAPA